MNIDIDSTSQFPEYEHADMPVLASSEMPTKSSSSAGPSYSKVRFHGLSSSNYILFLNLDASNNQHTESK